MAITAVLDFTNGSVKNITANGTYLCKGIDKPQPGGRIGLYAWSGGGSGFGSGTLKAQGAPMVGDDTGAVDISGASLTSAGSKEWVTPAGCYLLVLSGATNPNINVAFT